MTADVLLFGLEYGSDVKFDVTAREANDIYPFCARARYCSQNWDMSRFLKTPVYHPIVRTKIS
jgi:hypothetical protein